MDEEVIRRAKNLAERLVAALERQASESSRLAAGQQRLIRLLEFSLANRGHDVEPVRRENAIRG